MTCHRIAFKFWRDTDGHKNFLISVSQRNVLRDKARLASSPIISQALEVRNTVDLSPVLLAWRHVMWLAIPGLPFHVACWMKQVWERGYLQSPVSIHGVYSRKKVPGIVSTWRQSHVHLYMLLVFWWVHAYLIGCSTCFPWEGHSLSCLVYIESYRHYEKYWGTHVNTGKIFTWL